MKARIKFRKYGALRFIGHLDVMRYFQKLMRRAQIPIAFTSGYSPHMIMSFASPLGIGLTSDGEYFDIELTEAIASREAVRRMNAVAAEGIEVLSFRQIAEEKRNTGMAIVAAADYLAMWKYTGEEEDYLLKNQFFCKKFSKKLAEFLAQPEIRAWKQTKRSEQVVDIRPLIYQMEFREESVFMQLAAGSVQNLKPELVISAFCSFCGNPDLSEHFQWHRMELYALSDVNDHSPALITLEALGWEIGDCDA